MARELAEVVSVEMQLNDTDILFFDNVSQNTPDKLFGRFEILRSFEAVKDHFASGDTSFTLGLGGPGIRKKLYEKFLELGGSPVSILSQKAHLGSFETSVGECSQIMHGVIVTNNVRLGKGVLINIGSTISHDCVIGDFVEIACGSVITGSCVLENGVFVGSNASINPGVHVGENAIIGSGAVVIRDVPANTTVVGNPAKILKNNE